MVVPPAPGALVLSSWMGRGKKVGGKLKRTGLDTHITGRGGGPRRPPNGYGSH